VTILAQRLYIAHLNQLKSEIKALEEEFLTTTKEIEEIERGDWDDRFQKEVAEKQESENGLKRARTADSQEEVGDEDGEPAAKRSRVGSENEEVKEEAVGEVSAVETETVKEAVQEGEDLTQQETAESEAEAETKDEPIEPEPEEPEEPPVEVEEEQELSPPPDVEKLEEEDQAEETEEGVELPETKTKEEPELIEDSDGTLTQDNLTVEADAEGEAGQEMETEADHTPTRPKKPFPTLIQPLHSSLTSLKSATLFSNPIREMDAPGYSQLIKKPMDLKTLWKLVKDGTVADSTIYHREVLRMFANAIMYNSENCMLPSSFFVSVGLC
jgi:bromodomain-containing protein 8